MIGMDSCHMFCVFVHCLNKSVWMNALWGDYICQSLSCLLKTVEHISMKFGI
jgi:hypothetical protein